MSVSIEYFRPIYWICFEDPKNSDLGIQIRPFTGGEKESKEKVFDLTQKLLTKVIAIRSYQIPNPIRVICTLKR